MVILPRGFWDIVFNEVEIFLNLSHGGRDLPNLSEWHQAGATGPNLHASGHRGGGKVLRHFEDANVQKAGASSVGH